MYICVQLINNQVLFRKILWLYWDWMSGNRSSCPVSRVRGGVREAAQGLLVDRHWLTTSRSWEFSRAAATLSLSASCLFTEKNNSTEQTLLLSAPAHVEWKWSIPGASSSTVLHTDLCVRTLPREVCNLPTCTYTWMCVNIITALAMRTTQI